MTQTIKPAPRNATAQPTTDLDSIPKDCGGTGEFRPSDVIADMPLGTPEQERGLARAWMDSAAQASRNADYWRGRAEAAEALLADETLEICGHLLGSPSGPCCQLAPHSGGLHGEAGLRWSDDGQVHRARGR